MILVLIMRFLILHIYFTESVLKKCTIDNKLKEFIMGLYDNFRVFIQ